MLGSCWVWKTFLKGLLCAEHCNGVGHTGNTRAFRWPCCGLSAERLVGAPCAEGFRGTGSPAFLSTSVLCFSLHVDPIVSCYTSVSSEREEAQLWVPVLAASEKGLLCLRKEPDPIGSMVVISMATGVRSGVQNGRKCLDQRQVLASPGPTWCSGRGWWSPASSEV